MQHAEKRCASRCCRSTRRARTAPQVAVRRPAGAAVHRHARGRADARASSSPYIDWQFFFHAWDLKGKFPAILEQPGRARALRRRARRCSTRSSRDELLAGARRLRLLAGARRGRRRRRRRRRASASCASRRTTATGGRTAASPTTSRPRATTSARSPSRSTAPTSSPRATRPSTTTTARSSSRRSPTGSPRRSPSGCTSARAASGTRPTSSSRARTCSRSASAASGRRSATRPAPTTARSAKLFDLLGAREAGIELTESFAMTPGGRGQRHLPRATRRRGTSRSAGSAATSSRTTRERKGMSRRARRRALAAPSLAYGLAAASRYPSARGRLAGRRFVLMRTTLKRGVGRGADGERQRPGASSRPAAVSAVTRYRQPPPPPRSGLGLVGRILLGTLLVGRVARARRRRRRLPLVPPVGRDVQAHTPDVIKRAEGARHPAGRTSRRSRSSSATTTAPGSRRPTPSRSDTLMLIRADPPTKSISLLSFPRDLIVPIYCQCEPASYATTGSTRPTRAAARRGRSRRSSTSPGSRQLPDHRQLPRLQGGRRQARRRLDGRRPPLLQQEHRHGRDDYANINLQPGYQRLTGAAGARLRPLPAHRLRPLPRSRASRSSCARSSEQVAQNFAPSSVPSARQRDHAATSRSREGGASCSGGTVTSYALFAYGLPGGHFFQDRIDERRRLRRAAGADGRRSSRPSQTFTNPDVAVVEGRERGGARQEAQDEDAAAVARSTVTVLNGNGVAGCGGERVVPARPARLPDAARRRTA